MYRSDASVLPVSCRWPGLAIGLLAASLAQAQPTRPPAPLEYRSALEHYQPYREQGTASWRDADHPPGSGHEHAPPAAPADGQHDHHHQHRHHHHHQEPQP